MTWVRIDEGFPEHPKVVAAGADAAWLFVAGLCYCNRNLTDGFIPREVLARICTKRVPGPVASRLVDVNLWDEVSGGWMVHDYDQYQPNRAEVLAAREHVHATKAEAGRLGGIASGVARRKHERSRNEANEKQTGSEHEPRPDPSLSVQVRDIPTPVDTDPAGVVQVASTRLNAVADNYARIALEQANGINNRDAYARTAKKTALEHPDIGRYLQRWPTAPPDAIAAWLHGDKHSMSYYHDTHDDDVATIHHLHQGEPA